MRKCVFVKSDSYAEKWCLTERRRRVSWSSAHTLMSTSTHMGCATNNVVRVQWGGCVVFESTVAPSLHEVDELKANGSELLLQILVRNEVIRVQRISRDGAAAVYPQEVKDFVAIKQEAPWRQHGH